ncbi:hypothetical protein N7510_004399, partial [Penicillium lagena]|uniref:uncharacterized protein n=1 Tax=Penicillium lagena TaxID=94218 RepID=UPI0025414324
MERQAAKVGALAGRVTWGRTKVYLPSFVVALVRTPNLSPQYAQFRVPLSFNKLDLRDYLKNVYGVGVRSIRSYVEMQPVTRVTRDGKGRGPIRRPKSEKRMTVELVEPFVWPEEPKDLTPWEKESWDANEVHAKEASEAPHGPTDFAEKPNEKERKAYAEQAKEILADPESWRPTWKALGMDFANQGMLKPISRVTKQVKKEDESGEA